jgi:phosphate-selective porin OprO/OprP
MRRYFVVLALWAYVSHAHAQSTPQSPPPVEIPTALAAPTVGIGPRGNDYPAENVSVDLGGRVQFDVVDYALPQAFRQSLGGSPPLAPGVSFRRLRLDASGSIFRNTDYMLQIDFVNAIRLGPGGPPSTDVAVPTDAWIAFRELPYFGTVKIGNQKAPLSFEHLTSSRYLPFLERSLGFDAFAENFNNGFSPGISASDTAFEKRATWAVGVFKNTRSAFGYNVGDDETDITGRLTGLPIADDEGERLLHLGLGTSTRDADDGQGRHRARLDARNSPSAISTLIADTGLYTTARQYLVVPELAAVYGPFSMLAEYYASWEVDTVVTTNGVAASQGTSYLSSWYVEGHVFLTAERQAYNRNAGVFGAVKPNCPAAWGRHGITGRGAWQLTARYSELDLNDRLIRGGRARSYTAGVNWFLNQYVKLQANVFYTQRYESDTNGGLVGFASRLAFDF